MSRVAVAAFALAVASAPAPADDRPPASPYAGLETRAIKSLSESDIDELRRGGGFGLALPAELNGVPGPAHLLELAEEIPLSPRQVEEIARIHEEMRQEAIAVGARLIEAEAEIEAFFRSGSRDEARLRQLIAAAERARAELRFVHLSRHLATLPLLSAAQIHRYNVLRGYVSEGGAPDRCARVQEGHDPDRWGHHAGCG